MVIWRKKIWIPSVVLLVVIGAVGCTIAFKTYRLWNIASDTRSQIRYLIENGGTIGAAPASSTFSASYLGTIFGDNPVLLERLKSIVNEGLAENPVLNLGEVSALVVTYRKNEDNEIQDVVAHIIGGFPLDKRKPGFHRDGYFRNVTDAQLWNWGNTAIGFLGRDMVLFAENDEIFERHSHMIESIMSGDVLPLAETLDTPLYITAVLPNPRRALPNQLRRHIQALVIRGHLGMYEGQFESLVLTASPNSSRYALAIIGDIKTAAIVGLKTRWKGVVRETPWGPNVDPWWSYELAQCLENSTLERENSVIRFTTGFERVMVNVVLKSLERMGRDLAAKRGIMEDKMDPRIVDANMQTRKPLHYWSEAHRWGPNWPIAPKETNWVAELNARKEKALAEAQAEAEAQAALLNTEDL